MIAWLIFILVVLGAGVATNKMFKSGVVACVVASIVSAVAFQLIVAIQIGHLDKFWLIAVMITFPVGLLISGIEIWLFRKILGKPA